MKRLLLLLPLALATASIANARPQLLETKADAVNAGTFLGAARLACYSSDLGLMSSRMARHWLDKEFERINEEIHHVTMMILINTKFMRRARDIEPCKTFIDEKIIELDLLTR